MKRNLWALPVEAFAEACGKGRLRYEPENPREHPIGSGNTPLSLGERAGYSPEDIAHFYVVRRTGVGRTAYSEDIHLAYLDYLRDAIYEGKSVPDEIARNVGVGTPNSNAPKDVLMIRTASGMTVPLAFIDQRSAEEWAISIQKRDQGNLEIVETEDENSRRFWIVLKSGRNSNRGPQNRSTEDTSDQVLEFLRSLTPKQRLKGAKIVRKQPDTVSCDVIHSTLELEYGKLTTWEIQYHLIMAIGQSKCCGSLQVLRMLMNRETDATILYVALGHAFVQASREIGHVEDAVLEVLESGNHMLVNGALRAMATLRLDLDGETVNRIIDFVSETDPDDGLRFWPAAAAAGWRGEKVRVFLEECARSQREDIRRAASASLKGKYQTWRHL